MAEEGVQTKRGPVEIAAGWFGLLGVIAATAALVLVPVSLDPEAVMSNPSVAYWRPELRVLLATASVMLVAVAGVLVLGRGPVRVPVLVPALAFLGVSASSAFFSERPIHSLYGDRGEGLLFVAAGVLLFYTLARCLERPSWVRLSIAAATATAALVSVYGIVENYGLDPISGWGNPPFTDLGRSFATIGNSLTLAAYLTLMMGTATALYLGAESGVRRAAWLLALVLIGACWIYAETRGALLGAGVALPIVLLAVRRRMGTLRPLVVPIGVLVAAMGGAVAASMATGFSTLSARVSVVLLAYLALVGVFAWMLERGRARLALLLVAVVVTGVGVAAIAAAATSNLTLADLGVTGTKASANAKINQEGDVSLRTRLYIWRDTVPMILDRPLLGHGPDNYGKPFRPYMSEDLKALISDSEGKPRILNRAHSHLVQVAATTGLLGLAAYLWVLVSFFRNAYRRGGWGLLALSGAVLAYVIQIQTAFPSVATDVAFWGILGASVALMRLQDRRAGEPPEDAEGPPPPVAPKKGRGELLVAAAVVSVLTAVAVSTFLEQREQAAKLERATLVLEVRQAADLYKRIGRHTGNYPEAGVYTREKPIKNQNGRNKLRPSSGVSITTKITPANEFTVEGKNSTLAGTFRYSYDSATKEYSVPSGGSG